MKVNLLRSNGQGLVKTDEGRHALAMAPFYPDVDVERPKTRAECVDGPRPCPWVSCRHHLYLDVGDNGSSITFNFPDKEVDELVESCSLDVADRGGATQETIAGIYGVKPQSIDDIEQPAKAKLSQRQSLQQIAREQGRDGKRREELTDEALSVEGLTGLDPPDVYLARRRPRVADDDTFASLIDTTRDDEDAA